MEIQSAAGGLIKKGCNLADGETKLELDKELSQLCNESCHVTLIARDEVKGLQLKSNPLWISNELLQLLPRARDIQKIANSDGREGLFPLLDRLSRGQTVDLLLYYLQYVDFSDLYETMEDVRRAPRVNLNGNPSEVDQEYLAPSAR